MRDRIRVFLRWPSTFALVALLCTLGVPAVSDPSHAQQNLVGTFRIQSKASTRFLRVDEEGRISSKTWGNDGLSRFVLAPRQDFGYRIRVLATGHYLRGNDEDGPLVASPDGSGEDAVFTLELDASGAYRIRSVANNLLWHEDGLGDSIVRVTAPPDDDFTRFYLTSAEDLSGTYRIVVRGDGLHWHEDESSDKLVSTRFQPDDDFARFTLVRQCEDDSYRIRVQAIDRFLEVGSDQLLGARFGATDDTSAFYIEPVDSEFVRIRLKEPDPLTPQDTRDWYHLGEGDPPGAAGDPFVRALLDPAPGNSFTHFRLERVRDGIETACLLGGRFEVRADMYDFANPPGGPGNLYHARVQTYNGESSETDQSVSFYSFQDGNVELFVKMVNACGSIFDGFWVFAAGATNAETRLRLRDIFTDQRYTIDNPRSRTFQTTADTGAFLTCSAPSPFDGP